MAYVENVFNLRKCSLAASNADINLFYEDQFYHHRNRFLHTCDQPFTQLYSDISRGIAQDILLVYLYSTAGNQGMPL